MGRGGLWLCCPSSFPLFLPHLYRRVFWGFLCTQQGRAFGGVPERSCQAGLEQAVPIDICSHSKSQMFSSITPAFKPPGLTLPISQGDPDVPLQLVCPSENHWLGGGATSMSLCIFSPEVSSVPLAGASDSAPPESLI